MSLIQLIKSDNLIFMKTITATEAARNFSAILDAVEAGDEFEITRGNKSIAVISMAKNQVPNSVLLRSSLEKHFQMHGTISDEEANRQIQAVRQLRDADLDLEIGEGKWSV